MIQKREGGVLRSGRSLQAAQGFYDQRRQESLHLSSGEAAVPQWGQCGGQGSEGDQVSWEKDGLSDLRAKGEVFEASGSYGSETGVLLSRAVGEQARDLQREDEAQDRFVERSSYL